MITSDILPSQEINDSPFTEIGSSNFEEFATTKGAIFVDKTLLINAIIKSKKVTLITRPRRWGKTLNLSMLEYFFSIPTRNDGTIDEELRLKKYDILSKMAIGNHQDIMEQYCGKYPTIFMSFKEIKGFTYSSIEADVRNLVYKLYAAHEYLLFSSKLSESKKMLFKKFLNNEFNLSQLKDSIAYISEMLYLHFGQNVVVLIDEYDTPMNDWYSQKLASGDKIDSEHDKHLQAIFALFRGVFSAGLKDNKYLAMGVVTGILRIAKASLFSGLNNFGEDSILDDNYSKYFGFTDEEVSELMHRSNLDRDANTESQMKSWYNGYNIGGITIYNPWSIMNCLECGGKFKAYWVSTAGTELLENALMLDHFQEEVQSLIEGNSVSMIADPKMAFSDITSSHNAFYNLLLFSGYLTTAKVSPNVGGITYKCDVRIPNREVRGLFIESVQQWVINKFKITINDYGTLITYLLSGDIPNFTQKLKKYLEASASYFDSGEKSAELLYNGFIWGVFAGSIVEDYFVEKEKETGDSRADLLIIPKAAASHDIAFVLEYKIAKTVEDLVDTANVALEQIKNKHYVSKIKLHDNVSRAMGVGIAFCGKNLEVIYSELEL